MSFSFVHGLHERSARAAYDRDMRFPAGVASTSLLGVGDMKAIVIEGYGGPDQLLLRELPDPKPGAGEMLVRVGAAGVNPVDWKIRRGDLRMVVRLGFPYIPGGDIAGDVVDVGAGVTRFRLGDAIVAFVE